MGNLKIFIFHLVNQYTKILKKQENEDYWIDWWTRFRKIYNCTDSKIILKEGFKLNTVIFSIDDFYKTLKERKKKCLLK